MRKYNSPEEIKLFGRRLGLAIKSLDLTITEFAEGCGFTQPQVSNWVIGAQRISLDAMITMSARYGIPFTWIYEGSLEHASEKLRKLASSSPEDKWAK